MKKFIYLLISIINLGVSAFFISTIPNEIVPIHYDLSGKVDSWGNKWYLLLISSILIVFGIIYLLRCILVKNTENVKKNRKYEERAVLFAFLFFLALTWVIIIVMSFNRNMYDDFSTLFAPILCLLLGSLMVFMSNMYGKVKQNTVFGLKTVATLSSEAVWKKAHKLAGYLGVICGVVMIICGIVGAVLTDLSLVLLISALILFFIVGFVVPAVYAQIIYNKEK